MLSRLIRTACVGAMLVLCGCGGSGGKGAGANPVATPSTPATDPLPVVRSFSPPAETQVAAGGLLSFQVNLLNPAPATSYDWTVDGHDAGSGGPALDLKTSAQDPDLRTVQVKISNGGQATTELVWPGQVMKSADQNGPPSITSALPAGPVTLVEGEKVYLTVTATDPDAGDVLTYQWKIDDGNAEAGTDSLALDTNGLAKGDHTVKVLVRDDPQMSEASAAAFTWTVHVVDAQPANRPPVISGASPTGTVRLTSGSVIDLLVTASDLDGDTLSYTWQVNGSPEPVTIPLFRFSESAAKTYTVRVTVDDGKGGQTTNDWQVIVEAPPSPPPPVSQAGVVKLAWDAVTKDADGGLENLAGYRVYTSLQPPDYELRADVGNVTEAKISDLPSGVTLFLTVTAYDKDGNESKKPSPLSVLVP